MTITRDTYRDVNRSTNFSVTLNPDQLSDPTYFDVYGVGLNGYQYLHQAFVRVPITGHTVTGHDLAVTSLGISSATLEAVRMMTVTAVVENRGSFDESSVVASLYVNQDYVTNAVFPGLNSGENQEIVIAWAASFTAFYLLEVEIEPVPGEVERHNNAASISTTVAVDIIYLPLAIKF
jgi:subtilase family serine protease